MEATCTRKCFGRVVVINGHVPNHRCTYLPGNGTWDKWHTIMHGYLLTVMFFKLDDNDSYKLSTVQQNVNQRVDFQVTYDSDRFLYPGWAEWHLPTIYRYTG